MKLGEHIFVTKNHFGYRYLTMGPYRLILECLLILKLFLKNLQHCDDEEDHIFYVIFDFFCIFADIEKDNKFERSLNNDYLIPSMKRISSGEKEDLKDQKDRPILPEGALIAPSITGDIPYCFS